jgi:hypothetical protein
MSVIDTADRILETLGAQGTPKSVIDKVSEFRGAQRAIDDAQYQPGRAAELKAVLHAKTVEAGRRQLSVLEADAATAAAADVESHDRAAHDHAAQGDEPGADMPRITAARTFAELRLVMEDALAADPGKARRTWEVVRPLMRDMMADAERRHVMPSAHSAFTAYNLLELRMRELTRRGPDRTHVSEAGARRQRELRERVLAAWRVVGLDQEIARAAAKAAIPEAPESTLVVGGFFDRFKR